VLLLLYYHIFYLIISFFNYEFEDPWIDCFISLLNDIFILLLLVVCNLYVIFLNIFDINGEAVGILVVFAQV
jgi:hypothetical protein